MSERVSKKRCALCRSPENIAPTHLSYGVCILLCGQHGAAQYLAREGGRALVRRLTELWISHGTLNKTRIRALGAHLRRVEDAARARDLPGSYAWPADRAECERRFALGHKLDLVIAEMRASDRWAGRPAPSVRTIRRWYAQGRWLAPTRPDRPSVASLSRAARAALVVATTIATSYAWEDWISVHGGMSRGELRLRRALQQE